VNKTRPFLVLKITEKEIRPFIIKELKVEKRKERKGVGKEMNRMK
jgi:hypothetical protein